LADYIKTESYLAYIVIIDSSGQVQAHTFPSAVPSDILTAVNTHSNNEPIHISRRTDGVELEDFFIRAGSSHDGGVHIGIYETKIAGAINTLMFRLTPFILVVISFGFLSAFLFASAITRPLQVLLNGVKRVTRGDLDFRIEVRTGDEIGHLAEAFNQMTEKLRESTVSWEFMEKLINTMNEVLVVISPEGVIMNVNRAYSELFGSTSLEITGRHASSFEPSEAPSRMYAAYENSLENGRMQGIENLCLSASGEQIPLLLSLAVMRDEEGVPQAIICAAQNISTLKKFQETLQQKQSELEDINHNLENIVASRTAELAIGNEGLRAEVAERQKKTEELRAARDIAESANRSKSEFLANMSHEMRTPLNSIIGGAEYLDSAELNEGQQRCLTMIRHAGDSLLVLINDLIDLSRIEAGQLEIVNRPFNLQQSLDWVIQVVAQDIKRKSLKLTLNSDPLIPLVVTGDKIRLQQILVNLVTNAVKFTEDCGSISISIDPARGDLFPVIFSIKDTGIGIDPNKLDLIFDSFSQADTSITRRFGGSGLGLTISRKLVEAMGGAMQVESVPGVGSTFSFTLPFSATQAEPVGVINVEAHEIKQASTTLLNIPILGSKRVLLVDDSLENRQLMKLLLHSFPIELDEAGNGQEALDLFISNRYDLIFMDIQMPVMDGYTATRMIRRHEELSVHRKASIIALTAHAYESDIQKCLEAGCDGHIAKPFKKQTLLDCLAHHLQEV
ncbi:MAG: ATP-binding protein, partial [Desulfuromonadales bacterium]